MRRFVGSFFLAIASPFARALHQISKAPRELYIVFLISLLTSFGLSGGSSILVSYFSDEFEYSDVEASTLFALGAITYVVFGLFTGRIIDYLGIRRSLIAGGVLGVLSSMCIAIAWNRALLILAVLVLTPLTMLFISPVVTTAMKRYTFEENSRVAFMFAYVFGNIGAALSYVYVDFIRHRFSEGVTFRSYSATAARVIFMTGALSTLLGSLLASCGIRDIMVDEKGTIKPFAPNSNVTNEEAEQNERVRKRWFATFCEANFIRLVVFSFVMFPLMKVFMHFDVTFPKASLRQLGNDALFGTIKAVNPIMITFLQLSVSDMFRNFHIYNVIIIGATISALSVFIFALPPSYESWLAGFVIFTIGEMIFSHRVNELTTKLAPKGREGIYLTLTGVYTAVPSFILNAMSGWLLSSYCPEEGVRHCDIMWLLIGLMACATPVLLFPFRPYLLAGIPEPPAPPVILSNDIEMNNSTTTATTITIATKNPTTDND